MVQEFIPVRLALDTVFGGGVHLDSFGVGADVAGEAFAIGVEAGVAEGTKPSAP